MESPRDETKSSGRPPSHSYLIWVARLMPETRESNHTNNARFGSDPTDANTKPPGQSISDQKHQGRRDYGRNERDDLHAHVTYRLLSPLTRGCVLTHFHSSWRPPRQYISLETSCRQDSRRIGVSRTREKWCLKERL
jgi:hypothetical protein